MVTVHGLIIFQDLNQEKGIYNSANDDIINNLKQIEGIDNISYGYYETTRDHLHGII